MEDSDACHYEFQVSSLVAIFGIAMTYPESSWVWAVCAGSLWVCQPEGFNADCRGLAKML
jgi:hypothetical protein